MYILTNDVKKIDDVYVRQVLPKRKRDSHKGTYGKAAIVAGSEEYSGAAYLAAKACLRSGAGYTTLFLPKNLFSAFLLRAPELLLKSTNDGGRYAFKEEIMQTLLAYDSIAYGMGMGATEDTARGAVYLLQNYEGKLILDADGLNALAYYQKDGLKTLLQNKKCAVVITPHVKEFSRLSGYSVAEIEQNGAELAKTFAKENGITVLLKNAWTIITDGEEVLLNTMGNSGQAKAGSGDVLSGVIAGISAMGATVKDGAASGCYLAGKAAEIAVKERGEYSLLATDVIEELGHAFTSVFFGR